MNGLKGKQLLQRYDHSIFRAPTLIDWCNGFRPLLLTKRYNRIIDLQKIEVSQNSGCLFLNWRIAFFGLFLHI